MMTEAQKSQIKNAVMLLLAHGFTVTGPGGKSAGPQKEVAHPTPAPKAEALTVDGRHAYTCGVCGEPGHNARTHQKPAAAAAPVVHATPKASAPKAAPAPASVGLDALDFDMDDLGGAPVSLPSAPKAAPVKVAPKASAPTPAPKAAPRPAPPPAPEATDADVDSFLKDLDGLDGLFP